MTKGIAKANLNEDLEDRQTAMELTKYNKTFARRQCIEHGLPTSIADAKKAKGQEDE